LQGDTVSVQTLKFDAAHYEFYRINQLIPF
jgi:hypothetical protein